MMGVRRAAAADVEAMQVVAAACAEAPQWSAAVWRGAFAEDGLRVGWVAEMEGGVVGFIVVSCVAGVAEVESLAVLREARRRGVGRALCREGMAWARGVGARSMELEVRASSEAALGLYRSLGFVEQGRRKGYYREPVEDAVLMAAVLGYGKE
jgi:[ribosomal protein S18]-alanine N-acetyltransferase